MTADQQTRCAMGVDAGQVALLASSDLFRGLNRWRSLPRALLRLVNQSGAEAHLEQETALALSRKDLAELSETTIFIVSRVVSDWTRANVVTNGRGCIVVRDFKRLMQRSPRTARRRPSFGRDQTRASVRLPRWRVS